MPSGAGSHWGKLQNSASISSGVAVQGRATAFKVVDILGFSEMVDYEQKFFTSSTSTPACKVL